VNRKQTPDPARRGLGFGSSELGGYEVRILGQQVGADDFGGKKVAHHKILYPFTSNQMQNQDNPNTKSIDASILARTSSTERDGDLDMGEIQSEILSPGPHEQTPK
jgi:hypothetical protein